MDITSTNRFVDPAGCGSEFWRRCQGATDRLTRTTGFIDVHWHQNPEEAHTFHFVNVAVWESAQAFGAIFRGSTQRVYTLLGNSAHEPPPRRIKPAP